MLLPGLHGILSLLSYTPQDPNDELNHNRLGPPASTTKMKYMSAYRTIWKKPFLSSGTLYQNYYHLCHADINCSQYTHVCVCVTIIEEEVFNLRN